MAQGSAPVYLASVILFLGVLPVISIVAEVALGQADVLLLVGKWFVFWAVGVRLGVAGLRQMVNPEFTAKEIFELDDTGVHRIVVELGFANLAMGIVGLATLLRPGWLAPAGLAGAIYYALAGLQHARNGRRNAKENVALVSDLLIALVLAAWFVLAVVLGRG
jgi:hypothetical protein